MQRRALVSNGLWLTHVVRWCQSVTIWDLSECSYYGGQNRNYMSRVKYNAGQRWWRADPSTDGRPRPVHWSLHRGGMPACLQQLTFTHTSKVAGRSAGKRGQVFSYPSGMRVPVSSARGQSFLYADTRRLCGSRATTNVVHPSCASNTESFTQGARPSEHAPSHASHTSLGLARTASAALPPSC